MRQQAARSRSDVVVVVVVVLPAEEAAALSEAAMQAARAEHLSAVTPRAPVDADILCRPLHPVPSSLLQHFAV